MELQSQAMRDLGSLSSSFLGQRPYDQFLVEKKPNFFQSLMGGLGNVGGQAAGMGGNLAMLAMMGLI
jgi:hypothetical protein